MICDTCGATLAIGDWAFCPHGRGTSVAIGDEFVGGFVQRNFGDQPEIFYSKKAMLARADALGLQPFVQHAGEHEQHLTNWAAGATEKQLRDAAELLSRRSRRTATPGVVCETLETSVRELTIGVRAPVES